MKFPKIKFTGISHNIVRTVNTQTRNYKSLKMLNRYVPGNLYSKYGQYVHVHVYCVVHVHVYCVVTHCLL